MLKSLTYILSFVAAFSLTPSLYGAVPCNATDYELLKTEVTASGFVNSQPASMRIEIPLNAALRCTVSPLEYGDYIHFTFSTPVSITYTLNGQQQSTQVKYISYHPTILASERASFPYFIYVRDPQTSHRLYLYVNAKGDGEFVRGYTEE